MDPFLGEIRAFGFGITPKGWMPCMGQLLNINTNQALFSLLGTTYGGNGTTNFALPDYRGRVQVSASNTIPLGTVGGEESHTLTLNEMPAHTHNVSASTVDATSKAPQGMTWAVPGNKANSFATTIDKYMSGEAIGTTGGSQPHNNMQPYLTLNYCIAVQGIYPSRG
ncbi:Tail Collar domain protein [Paenibacillus curdlanolyticus YK9]|uniref:Tail Collar domain protein n=1 Tax=Paenibacillus curdlanolyticus YK9 TaxID=717606 RepID=E0I8Z9_9BACL|nr:tail fiber protein [Paenibacillus curdlanolyticus]EFM10883.1 Tail Collar domain protein [Paenibacillus curdlanolyticus YK9]